MNYKAENNNKLLYEIRKFSQIDVDYVFGKTVLGTELCGGFGYHHSYHSSSGHQYEESIEQVASTKNKE